MRYRGPFHAFKSIIKREGIRGLYRGLGANLVGVTPEKAIKLSVNDIIREVRRKLISVKAVWVCLIQGMVCSVCLQFFTDRSKDGKITIAQEVFAGAGAGFTQVVATNPMEIVKIRMQVQGNNPKKRMSTAQVVKNLGITGLYRGSSATLLRDVPFSALFFPLYANLKHLIGNEDAMLTSLVAGFIAGATASGICTPFDVIKTRLQVEGAKKHYDGMMDCCRKVFNNEGFLALYKGCGPRMMVVAPLFGISLVAFDVQKRFMAKQLLKARETDAALAWASQKQESKKQESK